MSLSLLVDLSPLERRTISFGVRRYAQQLALSLKRMEDHGALRAVAVRRAGLLGRTVLSQDLQATLEEAEDQRQRGLLPSLPPIGPGFLDRAARSAHADLVHCLTPESSPRGPLRVPRVVTCHHVDSSSSATEWHGAQSSVELDRRHFLRADRIIAPSRATAQELIARLDVPRAKIEVVSNAIDPQVWRPEPSPEDGARLAALGLERGSYFLCVGAASSRKNPEGMVSGLAKAQRLLSRAPLRMVWAGEQGRYDQEEALARARRLGIFNAVGFLGGVTDADLATLYRHAVALCFVSRREGFGYPVLEAMACGCPVLTSTCSSLGEIAGDAAMTVDPEDDDAIADALVLLWESAGTRERLRDLGRARVTLFSTEKFAEATLAAYRHTIRTTPG